METLVNAFMKKYPAYGRVMAAYERAVGEPPAWDNITKANLHAFTEQLCREVSHNSARTYIKMFKSVLNMYNDVVEMPKDYGKMLNVKGETTVSVYLDNHDIDRLIAYEPSRKYEDVVRNQFVLGCLTGARYSDYITFSNENIVGDKLVYISQKTKIKSEIPLAPAVKRIIENKSHLGYAYNRTAFNAIIKQICSNLRMSEQVQIFRGGHECSGPKWRFVSSHTARRSFATNLYLRTGNILLVSRLMGHTNVQMTSKYIMTYGNESEDVVRYFAHFK